MSEPRNRLDDIQESITEQSKDFVGDHALSSALVTFGLGVGVGLTVISLLSDSGPPRRAAVSERRVPPLACPAVFSAHTVCTGG